MSEPEKPMSPWMKGTLQGVNQKVKKKEEPKIEEKSEASEPELEYK